MSNGLKDELTIVRMLNAPRDKVWRACREAEALSQWWGLPDDATMLSCQVDFRLGGALQIGVQQPGRPAIFFKCIYRDIVEGEQLVMEQHLCDEAGREKDSPDWPATTITLRLENADGKTRLTVVHAGLASGIATVENFTEGWSQSLDRLANSLTRL